MSIRRRPDQLSPQTEHEPTELSILLGELASQGIPEETAFENDEFEEFPLPPETLKILSMSTEELVKSVNFR